MVAKSKENPYAGKVRLTIGGYPAEDLGAEYVAAIVTDWFIRSMYRSPSAADNPLLQQMEYTGMDYEKFCKGVHDV